MRRRTGLARGRGRALLIGSWAAVHLPASAQEAPASAAADASAPASRTARRDAARPGPDPRRGGGPAGRRAAGHRAAPHGAQDRRIRLRGSWFDARSGELTVAVTPDADATTVRTLRESGAAVRTVEHTERQLNSAKSSLDRLDAPAGVASWAVDPAANTVVVNVVEDARTDNDVRAFVRKARAAGPVTVRTVADAPSTFAAGTVGGDPYYTGNVRCSIGFSVHGGFVTAGHCGGAGQQVRGWDGSYIGNFQGSSFPDNDYAWVNVGSGWWTVPVVLGWGTVSDQLVRGSAEAPVGASICRSGSTTHWHCGTVLAKNETVNYAQGAVHQMTKTSVCAEGGDSGGSFISGDQAQGVTSGGWGNCSSGGETWFQPVNEILNRYGLTLHTA